jgi:hypothetical protein
MSNPDGRRTASRRIGALGMPEGIARDLPGPFATESSLYHRHNCGRDGCGMANLFKTLGQPVASGTNGPHQRAQWGLNLARGVDASGRFDCDAEANHASSARRRWGGAWHPSRNTLWPAGTLDVEPAGGGRLEPGVSP